jgi:hypothetical protein
MLRALLGGKRGSKLAGELMPSLVKTFRRCSGPAGRELLDRVLIIGARHLQAVLTKYQATTIRPGRTRASPSVSLTAGTTVTASPLPISTAGGSSANPSWAA